MNKINEKRLAAFGKSLEGKSREELCAIHRTLMHLGGEDVSAELLSENSNFVFEVAEIALVEAALMKIAVPTGKLELEYVDGKKETIKIW